MKHRQDIITIFKNYYECTNCGHEWSDTYISLCEDNCPNCGNNMYLCASIIHPFLNKPVETIAGKDL